MMKKHQKQPILTKNDQIWCKIDQIERKFPQNQPIWLKKKKK